MSRYGITVGWAAMTFCWVPSRRSQTGAQRSRRYASVGQRSIIPASRGLGHLQDRP